MDNTSTPVASLESAFAAQNYLLQFMFRQDFPVRPNASYAGRLSDWPVFSNNETVANIAVKGFEFGPQGRATMERCRFINELVLDPANGV